MKITKILNNNSVIVLDEQGEEQVVMGRGLGYQKRVNDRLDEARIEKVFALQKVAVTRHLDKLFHQVPLEVITACDRIIALAEQRLGKLPDKLCVALTDHCWFAIQRQRKGVPLKNTLLWEIRHLYPREFAIGQQACRIIATRLDVALEEDEAAFIALHLATAQLNGDITLILHATQLIQELLQVIKYQLKRDLDEHTSGYRRLLMHLKLLACRILARADAPDSEAEVHSVVQEKYPLAWRCATKITQHVQRLYHCMLTHEEVVLLTVHIERVRKETLNRV